MKNLLLFLSLLIISATSPCFGEIEDPPKNHYTIVRKLHEGYFSEVYEVQDLEGQLHALKWYKGVNPSVASEFCYLFGNMNRELAIGEVLDHPSIIKATLGWEDHLILELARGRHLSRFKKNSLTLVEAVHISLQLIDAMKHAFYKEYINIKLQARNVLLDEGFSVKIVDLAFFVSFHELKNHYDIESSDNSGLNFVHLNHFDALTDLCVEILDKVPLERNDRIDKRLAIKNVIWDLIEVHVEDQDIQFESSFDLLSEIIRSFV